MSENFSISEYFKKKPNVKKMMMNKKTEIKFKINKILYLSLDWIDGDACS